MMTRMVDGNLFLLDSHIAVVELVAEGEVVAEKEAGILLRGVKVVEEEMVDALVAEVAAGAVAVAADLLLLRITKTWIRSSFFLPWLIESLRRHHLPITCHLQ